MVEQGVINHPLWIMYANVYGKFAGFSFNGDIAWVGKTVKSRSNTSSSVSLLRLRLHGQSSVGILRFVQYSNDEFKG